MLGVAAATSSIAVGARCPWARAGVGAVSLQNITDPGLGPVLLDMLEDGIDPGTAIKQIHTTRENVEFRQITVIDADGQTAAFAGAKILGTNSIAEGADCIAAGNVLANEEVTDAMVKSFAAAPEIDLAERLLGAMDAGLVAGGERGPIHSAALYVVHDQNWPLIDLRTDWDDDAPLSHLRSIWRAYQPQVDAYVTRALDPASAPSFEVPGDP